MNADLLSQCYESGQMDSRQIEAHREAGELREANYRRVMAQPIRDDEPTVSGSTYHRYLSDPVPRAEEAMGWTPFFAWALALIVALAAGAYYVLSRP